MDKLEQKLTKYFLAVLVVYFGVSTVLFTSASQHRDFTEKKIDHLQQDVNEIKRALNLPVKPPLIPDLIVK